MYVTTQTQRQAIAQGAAQLFYSIFYEEFRDQYASLMDFLEANIYFITLTVNPNLVSLSDNIGFSTGRCFYQDLIDERVSDPWQLKSKDIGELVGFAKCHKLDIDDAIKLARDEIIAAIEVQLPQANLQEFKTITDLIGFARLHSLNVKYFVKRARENVLATIQEQIKEPNLQRPLDAIRPKPHPLEVFGQLHHNIARACLGSHIERKIRYQPIALPYVDFEGTRHGASVDPLQSSWPHVHAPILSDPSTS